jgi:two-component system, chemotaxis family, chemotaxis protein CheY
MSKRVALVGHCGPDSSYLRMTISGALKGAQVVSADDDAELHQLLTDGVDLLLFNREMPYGFSHTQGVKFIEQLRRQNPQLKMMLVSNYAEAQAEAVAAGALPGFGKREMRSSHVTQLLREAVGVVEKA